MMMPARPIGGMPRPSGDLPAAADSGPQPGEPAGSRPCSSVRASAHGLTPDAASQPREAG